MTPDRLDLANFRGGRRALRAALLAAAAGALLLAVGFFLDPRRTLFGYLTAYAYALSLALGSLLFLLIVNAMNATWPVALRRPTEALAATLPVFIPLFLPIVFGLRLLYPWVNPSEISDASLRALIAHKQPFLNPPFFVARAALYLVVWVVVSALLRRWSLATDDDRVVAEPWKIRARMLSAAALPAVGLTLTFASFDWLMSLTPLWLSTMYGFYFFAGGALGAVALLTVVTRTLQRHGLLGEIGPDHFFALGRLLLAFTVLWAYIAFFQFFLIWIADKPDEVPYFIVRMRTSWRFESIALLVGQFAIPFFLLLPHAPKRSPRFLGAISLWLVLVHYLDVHWLVVPSGFPERLSLHLGDLGGVLFVMGISVAVAVALLRGHPLVPRNDPSLARALAYRSK